jgi:hypothetical protein
VKKKLIPLFLLAFLFLASCGKESGEGVMIKEEPLYTFSLKGEGTLKEKRQGARATLFPGARSSTILLYESSGQPASGTLLMPKRERFQKTPIILFQHGLTGVADKCAPSRADQDIATLLSFYKEAFSSWLRAGYAIAMPDDPGLGTRGDYSLDPANRARAAYHMILAAREAVPRLGGYMNLGHSQGAGPAILLSGRTEDKPLANVIYAPAAFFETQIKIGTAILEQPSQGAALLFFLLRQSVIEAGVDPRSVFASAVFQTEGPMAKEGLSLWQRAERECLSAIVPSFLAPDALKGNEILSHRNWDKMNEVIKVIKNLDKVKGDDLLLLQGGLDNIVFPSLTDVLVRDLRAEGGRVDFRLFPEYTHQDIVNRSSGFVLRYLDQKMSGSGDSAG